MNDTKTTTTELTDEELFERYVAGDESSFAELHRRWKAPLARYLKYRVRDRTAVDDLIQLTFIRIMTYRDQFTPGKELKPWIYTIADRLSQDHAKSFKRRTKRTQLFSNMENFRRQRHKGGDTFNAAEAIEIRDYRHTPASDQMDHLESSDQALGLMRALPKHLRNSIQVLVVQGMSSREAGPVLNTSYKTVQNRARAGLSIIQQQMEQGIHGEKATAQDLSECTIRDLVDSLPDHEYRAIQRVLFEECGSDEDHQVFGLLICRLVGEIFPKASEAA